MAENDPREKDDPRKKPGVIDWDNANVHLTVPIRYGEYTRYDTFNITLEQFARLLLTQVPAEWFVEPPVSADLPLTRRPLDYGEPVE